MKGHVHAELMAQYAEDAKTNEKPWELWKSKGPGAEQYRQLNVSPRWYPNHLYRRKPKVIAQWELKVLGAAGNVVTLNFEHEEDCRKQLDVPLQQGAKIIQQPTLAIYKIED